MDTYTLVVRVPDGFSQDDLVEYIEAIERDEVSPVVTFCGPDALVEFGADDEHGPTVRTGMDGLTAQATVTRTPDGPLLQLHGVNCRLDGDCPGDYYLMPES